MDFSFSDEQSLLKDSVERFIQNDYAFDARQKLVKNEPGFSAKNWKTFAELGWLGVPFAEADGGFGGGPIETMLIMEQFGRGLVVEPFVPHCRARRRHAAPRRQPAHRKRSTSPTSSMDLCKARSLSPNRKGASISRI